MSSLLEVLVRFFRLSSIIVASLLTVVPQFGSAGESKRAFEIADYYRTAVVGSPVVTANGKKVAFTVSRYELETGTSWSEIWMMQTDGDRLRQMTHGRHHDGSPTFSPNGKSLLFASDRGAGSQLYLLPGWGRRGATAHELPDGSWRSRVVSGRQVDRGPGGRLSGVRRRCRLQ